jgi:hypothetical protein
MCCRARLRVRNSETVSVRGRSGTAKSRLCAAFFQRVNLRGWLCRSTLVVAAVFLTCGQATYAQISKGNRILLQRGLQLQGLVQWADFFHWNTYSNAYYTSPNWGWSMSPDLMSSAPGVPWSRWVSGDTNMPPQDGESPYLNQLIALQLGDEWNLQDGPTRTNLINWFASVRSNWPETILFHNNYAGQASDDALGDFIPKAQPDMLCFDLYPFMSV